MKKKGKIALIALLCAVLCIGVIAGSMAGVASKAIDKQNPDEFLSKWMSYIRDDALLTNVVIAGSHDSGTQDMMWAAKTQDKTLAARGISIYEFNIKTARCLYSTVLFRANCSNLSLMI